MPKRLRRWRSDLKLNGPRQFHGSRGVSLILPETAKNQDQLAAEAGYDVDRFFAQLRAWSDAHPRAGPVVRNAEELRRLAAGEAALALNDKPPPKS